MSEEKDITLPELISLAQPYELTISTCSLKTVPAITFYLEKDGLKTAQIIHLEDLGNSGLVKCCFESMKWKLENAIKERKHESMPYKPVCPRGYDDCVRDPAYIQHHYPDWYKELYHNLPPEKAIYMHYGCYDRMQEDPNEEYYCYDDEDK
jgi:hypothetical protein